MARLLERYFVVLLLGAYILAASFPALGMWLRSLSFDTSTVGGAKISLSLGMLGFLLFNAGLGLDPAQVRTLFHRPQTLLSALGLNLCVPAILVVTLAILSRSLHSDVVSHVMIGLALVAAMPIAHSSTAWAQNANANMALILSMVFCSTFLTPITTPIIVNVTAHYLEADGTDALINLSESFAGFFVVTWVIIPVCLGIVTRNLLGPDRLKIIKPWIKLANAINLLLLNYSPGSAFLSKAFATYQAELLSAIFLVATLFVSATFYAGWFYGGLIKATLPDRASLMFGLGMNNNGMALVLAGVFITDLPAVSLTIVFCTLIQHLVAATALWMIHPPSGDSPAQVASAP